MEKKINVAELLKDCPKGMELDCAMYEGVEFDSIVDNECFPIRCRIKNSTDNYNFYSFTKHGYWNNDYKTKCVIFPKDKTSWEGFCRPFVEGDVLYVKGFDSEFIFIYKGSGEKGKWYSHCYVCDDDKFKITPLWLIEDHYEPRFATEEERQKLFAVIEANGYRWNAEKKCLEKLKKEKFDISALKPFKSEVLARDNNTEKWKPNIWGFYDNENEMRYPYECCGNSYAQCIPYEGNEHLLGKTDDCDDFYKNWED